MTTQAAGAWDRRPQRKIADELTTESLLALARNDIGAIRVRGFSDAGVCASVVDRVLDHPQLGSYSKQRTSGAGRVFMPHIDTQFDSELTDLYHSQALNSIAEVRKLFAPYLSPIDELRLVLSELWPGGANVLRLNGRTCFVGALRVFQPKTSQLFPHTDKLDQETHATEARTFLNQLTANVYLAVPPTGGDLRLWLRPPSPDERAQILGPEGLADHTIEAPALNIHPDVGDLVLFSSALMHAVTNGEESHRVGMAAFIGVGEPPQPVQLWS